MRTPGLGGESKILIAKPSHDYTLQRSYDAKDRPFRPTIYSQMKSHLQSTIYVPKGVGRGHKQEFKGNVLHSKRVFEFLVNIIHLTMILANPEICFAALASRGISYMRKIFIFRESKQFKIAL